VKQALLFGPRDVRVVPADKPDPGDSGAVVRVYACGICGSDTAVFTGLKPVRRPFPMGHEMSGEVMAAGPRASGVRVGDRITVWCHYGALAEYTRIEPAHLAVGRLPGALSHVQGTGAQLLCACLRGVEAADVGPGRTCAIVGLGPVGLTTLQAARALGAGPLIGVEPQPTRRRWGERLGLAAACDPTDPDWADRLRAEHGPVDIVYDCVAEDLVTGGQTMVQAMRLLREHGEYVIIGLADRPRSFIPSELVGRKITIRPTFALMSRARELMDLGLSWIADGTVDVDSMVTHTFSLDDAPEALEFVAGQAEDLVKAVVHVTD
jgi:threonine dehydrogenase-like Zn-dependent dehydrogenase